jgi:hypothetical protein
MFEENEYKFKKNNTHNPLSLYLENAKIKVTAGKISE